MNDVSSTPKVTVRREIAASAEELFDAWLDPASLAMWMRPGDTPRTTAKVDPRVGGEFEIVMHLESGPVRHSGSYQEIDRPRRLAFTWISPHTKQTASRVAVDFHARRGTTEVVVTHELLPSLDAVAAHTRGWSGILKLLEQTFGGVS